MSDGSTDAATAAGRELLARIKLDGRIPAHIAVIMDGNGRWARARGLPRVKGHIAGVEAVRDTVAGAIEAGVPILTLFAFSQENWNRPAAETGALMRLLQRYVGKERAELREHGVAVRVFGDLSRLPAGPRAAVDELERYTAPGTALRLNLMISYGGRAEIVRAARRLAKRVREGTLDPGGIDDATFEAELYTCDLPDPDLLIRTSGEQRISNFLLWQMAYTELHISSVLWPDFRRTDLFGAILDYQQRDRRFGRVRAR